MPIQNTIGSVPVQALDPPPEGTMAVQLSFLLTGSEPSIAQALQLSSQSGLMMSQVVTICIDNANNGFAVSVTHGVFNETTLVPAYSSVIIPTFSAKTNYPINVAVSLPPGSVPLATSVQVNIIFMNYARTPGSFGATGISSIIGTNQNVAPILSGFINLSTPGNLILLPVGNYILSGLDIFCTGIEPATSAQAFVEWSLLSVQGASVLANIASSVDVVGAAYAVGGQNTPGGVFTAPINLNWSQGLLLPRGCALVFEVIAVGNIIAGQYRFNASGFATP